MKLATLPIKRSTAAIGLNYITQRMLSIHSSEREIIATMRITINIFHIDVVGLMMKVPTVRDFI
jgi:hypothetical protein